MGAKMKKPRKPRSGKARKPKAAVAPKQPATIPQLAKKTVSFWIGVVLAGLAVFGGIQDFFELADLVRTVTWKWDYWNHLIWASVFGYAPDKFPPGFATRLTFLLAVLIIGITALVQHERQDKGTSKPTKFWALVLQQIENLSFLKAFSIAFLTIIAFNALLDKIVFKANSIVLNEYWPIPTILVMLVSLAALLMVWFRQGISEFAHALLLIAFMTSFYFALAYTGATSTLASGSDAVFIYRLILIKGNYFGLIHTVSILQMAPPKYFNMVFCNIIVFVMLIVLLNYAIILKEWAF